MMVDLNWFKKHDSQKKVYYIQNLNIDLDDK